MAKARVSSIGDNPLDGLIMTTNGATVHTIEERSAPKKHLKLAKQRITVQISADVIERVKNAVYWTPGLTLASLAEEAFAKAVNDLEAKNGEPFQKRREELKTGRPIS